MSSEDGDSAERPSGKSLRLALLMLGLSAVGALTIGYAMRPAAPTRALAPARTAASVASRPRPAQAPRNELILHAERNGHFYVNADVNGTTVRFVVDTGATMVALTPKDAAVIGLSPSSLSYNMISNTAKGEARFARVKLREVRIDQLSIEDVPAAVMEDESDTSLLGMTFLSRLDGYRIRNGVLTMEW